MYQPGRMGIADGLALVVLAILPRVFLASLTQLLDQAATASWLTVIVAGAATLAALMALIYVIARLSGDLVDVTAHLWGRPVAWLVALWCMAAFFINTVLLLRQFAENTLITALPAVSLSAAVGWYALAAALITYYGIENLARAAYVILPFAIMGLLAVLALLAPFYHVYNLAPWAGMGWGHAVTTGLATTGFDIGALVLIILGPAWQDARTLRAAAAFGVGGGALLKSLAMVVFTVVFGVAVGREKTLPFFEMARLVYINRYLQRIEAFFIILWVIVGVLSAAIGLYITLYLLARLCHLPALRPLIPALAVLAGELALLPTDVAEVLRLDALAVRWFSWGLYALPLLLLLGLVLQGRRGKTCSSRAP